ncbi:unnamed protein product, partial [Gulo gulo]
HSPAPDFTLRPLKLLPRPPTRHAHAPLGTGAGPLRGSVLRQHGRLTDTEAVRSTCPVHRDRLCTTQCVSKNDHRGCA